MSSTIKKLNPSQTNLLLSLYKFRFITRKKLKNYQNTSHAYTHYRLTNLLNQNYISRHYSGKDKLQGKEAIYYLNKDGINYLKQYQKEKIDIKTINLAYKDKIASEVFIEKCLDIVDIYLVMRKLLAGKAQIYAKAEIREYQFIPKNTDLFITQGNKTYIILLFDQSATYAANRQKAKRIIEHFESNRWDEANQNYPTILAVCASAYLEKQVLGFFKASTQKYGADYLKILTTTLTSLLNTDGPKYKIWTAPEEPNELHSINN